MKLYYATENPCCSDITTNVRGGGGSIFRCWEMLPQFLPYNSTTCFIMFVCYFCVLSNLQWVTLYSHYIYLLRSCYEIKHYYSHINKGSSIIIIIFTSVQSVHFFWPPPFPLKVYKCKWWKWWQCFTVAMFRNNASFWWITSIQANHSSTIFFSFWRSLPLPCGRMSERAISAHFVFVIIFQH